MNLEKTIRIRIDEELEKHLIKHMYDKKYENISTLVRRILWDWIASEEIRETDRKVRMGQ